MLQLALAALLAGAPLNAAPAETPNGDDKAPRTEASVGIFKAEVANDEAIVNDTYSFGRAEPTFVKFWVGYGWGRDNEFYGPGGNVIGLNAATGGEFSEVTVQRAFVGAQVDFLNFPAFRAGVGAQLMTGQNTFTSATGGADVGSDFGLQNAPTPAAAPSASTAGTSSTSPRTRRRPSPSPGRTTATPSSSARTSTTRRVTSASSGAWTTS